MIFHMENFAQEVTRPCSGTSRADSLQASACEEIKSWILGNLQFVLERQYPRYPFINTKLDIASGEDFAQADPIRGPSVIYSWIQGRGLEALAAHGLWIGKEMPDSPQGCALLEQIGSVLKYTVQSMEGARARNGGRLPFMMDAGGVGLRLESGNIGGSTRGNAARSLVVPAPPLPEAHSFSDLFYAKGLMACADFLKSAELAEQAQLILDGVIADLHSGRFYFGQEELDPKNPVRDFSKRVPHAGHMIAIGAMTTFWRCTGDGRYRDLGLEFIRWILEGYSESGSGARGFMEGDFWEFLDLEGKPWATEKGQVWSDPGHAIEFVGLALAHLAVIGVDDEALQRKLTAILFRNFSNGFSGRGIIKSFDLAARKPINTDMPWWSLPEAMRAAALVASYWQKREDLVYSLQARDVFHLCRESFAKYYVCPARGFMAVQCLRADGTLSDAIPATPDADPCYHTGLSLLCCLPWLRG